MLINSNFFPGHTNIWISKSVLRCQVRIERHHKYQDEEENFVYSAEWYVCSQKRFSHDEERLPNLVPILDS